MVFILCSVLLALYIIRAGCNFFINYYGHVMGVKMQGKMRSDLFEHLEKLPYSFYDNTETGSLMSRMTNDLFEVSELAHHGPENFFITTFVILSSFIYIFTINWKLSLIILAFLPFLILIVLLTRNKMDDAFKKSREEIAGVNAVLENSLSGIRTTKAFANAEYEQKRFDKTNAKFIKARSGAYKYMGIFFSGVNFVTTFYNVVVLVAGAMFCIYDKENFDYADLVAFMLAVNLVISPITTLVNFFEQLKDGSTGFKRFLAIMDVPVEEESPNAVDLKDVKGKIEFNNVTFAYDENGNVLKDFSLTIPCGKTYAFVGESGGGKTTICHLVPKFYRPQEGTIKIDDIDINELSNSSLRKNVGIVQQDVFLFTGSFKENILYGDPNATDDQIVSAAKRAEIHDFIMAQPDGYDAQIGEKGVKLSGGQKQRLAIARLFLKNPPILILDEATSALDNVTELAIKKSLAELCKGRTTLLVAHRLSTVRTADKIVVLDKGNIIEEGSHEELLAKNGAYKKLHDTQDE